MVEVANKHSCLQTGSLFLVVDVVVDSIDMGKSDDDCQVSERGVWEVISQGRAQTSAATSKHRLYVDATASPDSNNDLLMKCRRLRRTGKE